MIPVRPGVGDERAADARVFLPEGVNDSDAKEFAASDRYERAIAGTPIGRHLFDDVTYKANFISTFRAVKGLIDLQPGHTVLELGAAHGWASVMLKDDVPDAYVVVSDLVADCLRHCEPYERLIGRAVDEKWAFNVRDMPFESSVFDRIFTFASFHHFGDDGDFAETFTEMARVLKPGGRIALLYEPTAPAYLHAAAASRANRKREHDGVDEDVLVLDRLEAVAARAGLTMDATLFPYYHHRSSVAAAVYYYALAKLRLARVTVCTANILFEKP